MTIPNYRDLIYLTWKQYVFRFDVVLLTNLLVALPVHVVVTLVSPTSVALTEQLPFTEWLAQAASDPGFWLAMALNIVSNIMFVYIEVVLILLLRGLYYHRTVKITNTWFVALWYYPAAVMVTIITLLATLFGLLAFVVPGIVIGVGLSLALPVLVWEKVTPWQAIRRSFHLVIRSPQRWRIFSAILLTQMWLSLAIWLLVSALPPTPAFTIFGLTVASILTGLQTMFHVIVYTACIEKPITKK